MDTKSLEAQGYEFLITGDCFMVTHTPKRLKLDLNKVKIPGTAGLPGRMTIRPSPTPQVQILPCHDDQMDAMADIAKYLKPSAENFGKILTNARATAKKELGNWFSAIGNTALYKAFYEGSTWRVPPNTRCIYSQKIPRPSHIKCTPGWARPLSRDDMMKILIRAAQVDLVQQRMK